MKKIKYKYLSAEINRGTDEEPNIEQFFIDKFMPYSETNEEIAKKEAYNGEYTVEDDGQPEPEARPTEAERIAELEEALNMLLSGVTE